MRCGGPSCRRSWRRSGEGCPPPPLQRRDGEPPPPATTNSFLPALPRSECGRIEQDNASLTSQIDGQRTAQAEVYFYLQKKLEDNYENIATLEARVSQDREMRARK